MTIITPESDPDLWSSLYGMYHSQKNPRNVVVGNDMYLCVMNTDGIINFHTVDELDYIDSRSLLNSRGATYKKLDG